MQKGAIAHIDPYVSGFKSGVEEHQVSHVQLMSDYRMTSFRLVFGGSRNRKAQALLKG